MILAYSEAKIIRDDLQSLSKTSRHHQCQNAGSVMTSPCP
jgi:hypothetical protein